MGPAQILTNVGKNLDALKHIYTRIKTYGVEINKKAYQICKTKHICFNSSIYDFKSKKKYDLVFTIGVLIHQNPKSLNSVINKIIDISQKYIFGHEYYSENLMEIDYRGNKGVMWKQDFPKLFKKIELFFRVFHILNHNQFHKLK